MKKNKSEESKKMITSRTVKIKGSLDVQLVPSSTRVDGRHAQVERAINTSLWKYFNKDDFTISWVVSILSTSTFS